MSHDLKDPLDTKEAGHSTVGEIDHDRTQADISDVSPEDEARIRRKIDLHLLPLICAVVAMQFVSPG